MKKLALALTACGDSEPAEKDLTKAEFVSQANEICKAGEESVTTAAESLGDNPTPADIEAFVQETAIPETREVAEKIDDLEAPDEIEADVEAMTEALETALDKVEADWQAFMSDDLFADANTKATELGLTDCAD